MQLPQLYGQFTAIPEPEYKNNMVFTRGDVQMTQSQDRCLPVRTAGFRLTWRLCDSYTAAVLAAGGIQQALLAGRGDTGAVVPHLNEVRGQWHELPLPTAPPQVRPVGTCSTTRRRGRHRSRRGHVHGSRACRGARARTSTHPAVAGQLRSDMTLSTGRHTGSSGRVAKPVDPWRKPDIPRHVDLQQGFSSSNPDQLSSFVPIPGSVDPVASGALSRFLCNHQRHVGGYVEDEVAGAVEPDAAPRIAIRAQPSVQSGHGHQRQEHFPTSGSPTNLPYVDFANAVTGQHRA